MELFSKQIRLLYGRSTIGERNRSAIKISITPTTMSMLKKTIDYGKGRYGSSFVELSIRLLVALANSGEDLDLVASELYSVCKSPYMTTNLRRLIRIIETSERQTPL